MMVRGLETLSCDLSRLVCRREDEEGCAVSLQEGLAGRSGVCLLSGCQGRHQVNE